VLTEAFRSNPEVVLSLSTSSAESGGTMRVSFHDPEGTMVRAKISTSNSAPLNDFAALAVELTRLSEF
jgi:hypothetical protein